MGWGWKGPEACLALIFPKPRPLPLQVSSALHLSWTHLPACVGPGFSGWALPPPGPSAPLCSGWGRHPPVLWAVLPPRQRPGPDVAPVEQQRGEGSHGWWAEALLLRGPHFGCWSWRPGLLASGVRRACVCSLSICFWNPLIVASATLHCCLARAGVCVSLPCTPRRFLPSSPTASVSLSFSKHTTECQLYADKYGDNFIFLKQNSITQIHFCCSSKARSSRIEFQFLPSLIRMSQPPEPGHLGTWIPSVAGLSKQRSWGVGSFSQQPAAGHCLVAVTGSPFSRSCPGP